MNASGRSVGFATGVLAWLFLSARAVAQGCVSCYTTVAGGGSQTAHALRSGILVLVFPPVVIFGGILFAVQRWNKRPARAAGTDV